MLYLYNFLVHIGESSGRQESRAGRARERSSDGEIGCILRVALKGGGFADLCVLALSMILPLRTSFNLSCLILW